MSSPDQNTCCTAASAGLIALAQTAIGCGVGLLLSGKLRRFNQRNAAVFLFAAGAAATAPVIYDVIARRVNRPGSERAMRRRLQSIREDSGFSEAEMY